MTQAEFATLRDKTWLTDAVLTFFLKTFVHDEDKGIHCLSSGFFKLIAHRNGGVYNYEESVENFVRNQFNEYEEGLASVKQLLTPINISDQHWIFLRVKMEAKRIELYDSMGKNPENKGYMETMRRFIYDELHKDTPVGERPGYDEWKKEWKYSDRSQNAPRQFNTYDCGVFTLVSMYLLSRGLELSSSTYDQQSIYRRKVRLCIAHLILQKNQLQEGATGLPPMRSARTRRRRPINPACTRKKVRRENETRMTATGTGVSVEGAARHSDARAFERTHSLFKRKAESEASAQLHGHTSTQRQLPPAKKRKKKRRTAD